MIPYPKLGDRVCYAPSTPERALHPDRVGTILIANKLPFARRAEWGCAIEWDDGRTDAGVSSLGLDRVE